jgi:hypothetical protein
MTPKERSARERILGRSSLRLWLFIGVCVLLGLASRCAFAAPQQVEYNPEKSPLPLNEMQQVVEYATEHVWSQYIDVGSEYAGTTGEVLVDGKIIVRWEHLTFAPVQALIAKPTPGISVSRADLGLDMRLGYAQWWWRTDDGSFVKAEIVLNIDFVFEKHVDECIYELVVHEIGHVYEGTGKHSDQIDDVMYPTRGHCRYSPSLSDLALFNKPLKSCHVELTPDGDLEYLDHKGTRVKLLAAGENRWTWAWGEIYHNPSPGSCSGVHVAGDEVWAEVWSFHASPAIFRLKKIDGGYTRLPIP